VRRLHRANPVWLGYITYLEHGSLAQVDPAVRDQLVHLLDFVLVDGLLYRLAHPRMATGAAAT
jgi:hypothetical protein